MNPFYELGLTESLAKTVAEAGYENPTPIQSQVIPALLQGRDVMAIAQTGTGKTASFTLPAIDILSQTPAKARLPRVLIVEPTRELAVQVLDNFNMMAKGTGLKAVLLIGGESMFEQDRLLSKSPDVIIATPGRLLDLFERGRMLLQGIEIFVIDEADRMLDMGFIPDIEQISKLLPAKRQNVLLSATMPAPIKALSQQFMQRPKEIEASPPSTTATTIKQYFIKAKDAAAKREALRCLIKSEGIKHAIVFCNRKSDIEILKKSMDKHGFNAGTLHGDMPQSARNEVLQKFKNNEVEFLLASDVAARGIDIQGLPYVVNFDVPKNKEEYVHRIGRTGRAGMEGHTFMLVSPLEEKKLKLISSGVKTVIEEFKIKDFDPNFSKSQHRTSGSRDHDSKKTHTITSVPDKPVLGFGENIPDFMKFKA